MDGYTLHPPAQDSATGGYSLAAKGGLAGVLFMILLAVVVSVFFKCRNCSVKFEVDLKCQKGAMSMLEMDVEMPEKSVHAGK
jgi:hypothetical protein